MAFERATQQAFLEAHVAALEWFGGAFDVIRHDNLKAAVAQVLSGRRRIEFDRFVALRSHDMFDSVFLPDGRARRAREGRCRGRAGRALPSPPPGPDPA